METNLEKTLRIFETVGIYVVLDKCVVFLGFAPLQIDICQSLSTTRLLKGQIWFYSQTLPLHLPLKKSNENSIFSTIPN